MYHASKNHCSPIFVLILTPVIKYSFLYQVCLDHSLRLTDLIPILFCSFPQFGPINNIKIIIMGRDSNNTYILDFTQSSPWFLYFTNNTHMELTHSGSALSASESVSLYCQNECFISPTHLRSCIRYYLYNYNKNYPLNLFKLD